MHPFEQKIEAAIIRHKLISAPKGTVISTLSGGADSVALLAAMVSLGYNCVAAHCNFHLRGAESDRDELHAGEIAALLGTKFVVKHFDVHRYIADSTDSISVEMACRELRYSWFEQLRSDLDAQAIAVAHNADDNTETLLLNLTRGCGIAGVRGMRWHNDRHIIRPMLNCHRHEIEQYLHDRGITYITDSTNLENDFSRNRIRNIVMPAIRSSIRNSDAALQLSLRQLNECESFYRQAVVEKKTAYTLPDSSIDLHSLIANEKQAALLLFEWLRPSGLNRTQTDSIIASAYTSGRKYPADNGYYLINRGVLQYCTNGQRPMILDELFEITEHPIKEFQPVHDPDIAYFDACILQTAPLNVRPWQHGDRLEPFGMRGSRKVSDIFSDAKLSLAQKNQVPLLVSGDKILWVAGIRASRHFPINKHTERFITVRYKRHATF